MLAEGVAARLVIKPYATGVITENTLATSSTDLGVSGGQIIRRVAANINLTKDTYQSNEVRPDRQIYDFRHGTRRNSGTLSGELSPGTYEEIFEAVFRGTWAAVVTGTETDFGSVSADNATSKFTFAGGDPVTKGFRTGYILRFTNLSAAGNNAINFVITGFGGTSNREVTVFPAPTTMGADTSFSLTSLGRSLIVPTSAHVKRKFGIEVYHDDIDESRLFTECRFISANVQLPATGMVTTEFGVMGRGYENYTAGDAPFFTAPAAATTSGIFASVNGLLMVGGVRQGVVTAANIQINLPNEAPAVVGQNFVPEVFAGRAEVTGQLTYFLQGGSTLLENFNDEDEISVLIYLTTTSAADSPALTIFMPRVKLGSADVQTQGEAGQTVTSSFQALLHDGGSGNPNTTIQMIDSTVSA